MGSRWGVALFVLVILVTLTLGDFDAAINTCTTQLQPCLGAWLETFQLRNNGGTSCMVPHATICLVAHCSCWC